MESFSEDRINKNLIILGTMGGSKFQTSLVTVNSGYEFRNVNWLSARGSWDIGERDVIESEAIALHTFFNARKGRAQAFRFKDWLDYKATEIANYSSADVASNTYTKGIIKQYDNGITPNKYQLFKEYTSGVDTYNKKISKPVSNTIKVYANSTVNITSRCNFDYTNGSFTVNNLSISNGTNITAGTNTILVFSSNPNLQVGDSVTIIGGGSFFNEKNGLVTNVNGLNITTNINSSGQSNYSGAFSINQTPSYSYLTWSGEFDKPVRFDTDDFKATFIGVETSSPGVVTQAIFTLNSLPIVEIRL